MVANYVEAVNRYNSGIESIRGHHRKRNIKHAKPGTDEADTEKNPTNRRVFVGVTYPATWKASLIRLSKYT